MIRETAQESTPSWPAQPTAPEGARNIVMIVLDDLGYAQLGCYGGLGGRVQTPHLDRLAGGGVRYRNFHVTPLCSPTRAALLTGRNAHSVGVGTIMEYATGFPGYNSRIPSETAMLPAMLREHGWSTMALGKWHLAPDDENGPWGPFDRWPLGQGFERFYGFLPGETSQWKPEVWRDNHRVDAPATPEDGYHLSEDLVDTALTWLDEQRIVAPDKPFFTYLAFGAMHAPHHAPAAWIEPYRGAFDDGWDRIREDTLALQKEMGVVPEEAELSQNDGVARWDSLSDDERTVFARQMEVFAGFLSHTDHQIGRLLEFLEQRGELDDTIIAVVSDNGASAEGGPVGLFDEISFFNRRPEELEEILSRLDDWGGPESHPHYAMGWAEAGNTPNRWYKTTSHEGGTRVPFILHCPGEATDAGSVRPQYAHAIDLVPTLLDAVGLPAPETVRGVAQRPFDGASFLPSVRSGTAEPSRTVQHYECFGHRAIWSGGWKAVAIHRSTTHAYRVGLPAEVERHDGRYDLDEWELFHLESDFAERRDLSGEHPDRLEELVGLWWQEARQHQVLPLDDRGSERMNIAKPLTPRERGRYDYRRRVRLGRSSSPDLRNRSFSIAVDLERSASDDGVLVSYGGSSGGLSLFVRDGRAHAVVNYLGRREFLVEASQTLPVGKVRLELEFVRTADHQGDLHLRVDGDVVGRVEEVLTNPVVWAIGQGVQIGGDAASTVTARYRAPYEFAGHIHQATVTLGDREDTGRATALDDERLARVRQ